MLLGVDTGLGIAGLSAISALNFVTESIAPKRVVRMVAQDRLPPLPRCSRFQVRRMTVFYSIHVTMCMYV